MISLDGKKVLISGAARRVGRHLCKAFADEGAKILIHYHRSAEDAQSLFEELGGGNAGHALFSCDLANPDAAREMIRTICLSQAHGPAFDLLINNAASYERESLAEESPDAAAKQFAINYQSPLAMIREFAKHANAAHDPAVLNIIDQAIVRTAPEAFSYLQSKKLLAELTRSAALAYAPGLRVNGLAPGPLIAPPGLEHLKMEKTLRQVPLGRKVELEDFSAAAIFLAKNRSITGEILFVDCGQSLR